MDFLDKRMTQAQVGKNALKTTWGVAGEMEEEKKRLEQYYEAIGKLYIQKNGQNLSSEYEMIYKKILESENRIRELKEQMTESSSTSNMIQCPKCYAKLSTDSIFCNNCGAKIKTPECQENSSSAMSQENVYNKRQESGNHWKNSSNESGAISSHPPISQMAGSFYSNITEEQLPSKFKPISPWGYFGWNILFSIPLIGLILALIKAFGNTENVNLRNYARSMFCYIIILVILWGIIFGTTGCLAGMMA